MRFGGASAVNIGSKTRGLTKNNITRTVALRSNICSVFTGTDELEVVNRSNRTVLLAGR